MKWHKEEVFLGLLQKFCNKKSRSALEEISLLAKLDGKLFYKHVALHVIKLFSTTKPSARVQPLYILSEIVTRSKAELGSKDPYGPRFGPFLEKVAEKLGEAKENLEPSFKVLRKWEASGTFEAGQLALFQSKLKAAEKRLNNGGLGPKPLRGRAVSAAPPSPVAPAVLPPSPSDAPLAVASSPQVASSQLDTTAPGSGWRDVLWNSPSTAVAGVTSAPLEGLGKQPAISSGGQWITVGDERPLPGPPKGPLPGPPPLPGASKGFGAQPRASSGANLPSASPPKPTAVSSHSKVDPPSEDYDPFSQEFSSGESGSPIAEGSRKPPGVIAVGHATKRPLEINLTPSSSRVAHIDSTPLSEPLRERKRSRFSSAPLPTAEPPTQAKLTLSPTLAPKPVVDAETGKARFAALAAKFLRAPGGGDSSAAPRGDSSAAAAAAARVGGADNEGKRKEAEDAAWTKDFLGLAEQIGSTLEPPPLPKEEYPLPGPPALPQGGVQGGTGVQQQQLPSSFQGLEGAPTLAPLPGLESGMDPTAAAHAAQMQYGGGMYGAGAPPQWGPQYSAWSGYGQPFQQPWPAQPYPGQPYLGACPPQHSMPPYMPYGIQQPFPGGPRGAFPFPPRGGGLYNQRPPRGQPPPPRPPPGAPPSGDKTAPQKGKEASSLASHEGSEGERPGKEAEEGKSGRGSPRGEADLAAVKQQVQELLAAKAQKSGEAGKMLSDGSDKSKQDESRKEGAVSGEKEAGTPKLTIRTGHADANSTPAALPMPSAFSAASAGEKEVSVEHWETGSESAAVDKDGPLESSEAVEIAPPPPPLTANVLPPPPPPLAERRTSAPFVERELERGVGREEEKKLREGSSEGANLAPSPPPLAAAVSTERHAQHITLAGHTPPKQQRQSSPVKGLAHEGNGVEAGKEEVNVRAGAGDAERGGGMETPFEVTEREGVKEGEPATPPVPAAPEGEVPDAGGNVQGSSGSASAAPAPSPLLSTPVRQRAVGDDWDDLGDLWKEASAALPSLEQPLSPLFSPLSRPQSATTAAGLARRS